MTNETFSLRAGLPDDIPPETQTESDLLRRLSKPRNKD